MFGIQICILEKYLRHSSVYDRVPCRNKPVQTDDMYSHEQSNTPTSLKMVSLKVSTDFFRRTPAHSKSYTFLSILNGTVVFNKKKQL